METHIAGPVKKSLDRFEEKFKDLLTSKVSFADFILQYVSEKQGKRIRPIVIFLSSKLHGAIDHDAIQSALVIEMFHTATLIHDDVVDESNQRRGERTVNDRWNNKTAVLIGDFLFSKTLAGMVELENKEALRLLATASEAITEGELLQIASSGKSNLSESEYYEIIQNKTAVLFRIASQLGVLCNNGNQTHFERMGTFGDHFGMAFQIMDDVLDFIGSSDKMGKPSCKDIREKKLTLPLIHVMEQDDNKFSALIRRGLDKGFSEDEIDHIQNKVVSDGGIEFAVNRAGFYAQSALELLSVYPDNEIRQAMEKLVSSSTKREK